MTKMRYKVTQQYAKGEEQALASFLEPSAALFFIDKKILADSEKSTILIYRLFDDQKLLQAFNKEKVNCVIRYAQYESFDNYLPSSIGHFSVSTENSVMNAFATFTTLNDAEFFVEEKLTQSDDKDETKYYIFERNVLSTQMDKHIKKQLQESDTSQGKGQTSSFRPTPFNTAPRPPGSPQSWVKDNNEDENNKK